MSDAGLRFRDPSLQYHAPLLNAQTEQPARARAKFYVDFYVYTVPILSLPANGTLNTQLFIQADSDFEWIESTFIGTVAGAASPVLDNQLIPVTLQLTDGGSGRQLFSAPTPVQQIAGSGKLPFILPESRVFKSRTTIQFLFVNLDAANAYNSLFFSMIGRKIFQFGQGERP